MSNADAIRVSARKSSRLVLGGTEHKPSNLDGDGLAGLFGHPINVLLVFLPLGLAADFFHWDDTTIFFLNFTALVPLAKILGDATEEFAAGLKNDMLAGLLNATFGNAVEVVIMVNTLRAGYLDVVKASLLGSVLSNLLLVLGCSFFFGGIMSSVKKHARKSHAASHSEHQAVEVMEYDMSKTETFSVMTAMVNTSMLLLSCLSFSLVTVFHCETAGKVSEDSVLLPVSRGCSVVIMLSYCAYIFFQLVTHRESMAEEEGDGDEEEEPPALSIPTAVTVMLLTTFLVAICSELMVSSLEGVVEKIGISKHFIGIILLPIVGNACEHVSAIRFAIKDKCGLSIGIAIGSSTQIALFVVPFSVMVGAWLNQPMDLNFGFLNTAVLAMTIIVVMSIVVDGTANWLQGHLLVSAYIVVAVLYWHLPNK